MKKLIALLMTLMMAALTAAPCMAEFSTVETAAQETAAQETAAQETAAQETAAAEPENAEEGYEYEDVFAEWNPDAPALNVLIDFVEDVTDESSENFIPEEDRIAVFDMDGTVYGELFPTYLEYYMLAWRILKDPSIEPDADMMDVGRTLRDCALDNSFPSDMPIQHAIQAARAYAGLTLPEFAGFVTEILLRDVDGFEGMTYGEAFYPPMVEVVQYLRENNFKVFLVSGSDRFICRTLIEGHLDIPEENVIGMDVGLEATGQNGMDGLDYVYTSTDDVIRTDELLIKNLKMNKVFQIAQEVGRQPVLSFGNSSGDVSMHMYTLTNNPYKSAAFMLIADDDERDYANVEKALKLGEQWEESGFNVISMKNDFLHIYPEGVVKTGSFHWTEELQEDPGRGTAEASDEAVTAVESEEAEVPVDEDAAVEETEVPADAAAEAEAAPEETAEEAADIQYVMYLGTNDKDTNEPVFEPEEAKEQLKQVLINLFGGYTIQEASGGWIDDDGTVYQEYTLVIYLSDTTEEQVHKAADELISLFHQSSVLIQANNTSTEFYAGAE